MKISPAGVVFVLMAIGVVGGFLLGKLTDLQFMTLAGMTFAFYYATPREKQVTQTPNGPIVTSYIAK